MTARALRARRAGADYWPGFVDALATLLLVVIFVLSVFIVAQFYLTNALSGRDAALRELNRKAAELAELLALEREAGAELSAEVARLSASLQTASGELDSKAAELAASEQTIEQLRAMITERDRNIAVLGADLAGVNNSLTAEKEVSAEALAQVALLNNQMAALRAQLARLQAGLDESEARDTQNQVIIAELGSRLNQALAAKVEELAGYRSEFFGQLRRVLGDVPGIRVEGDRFVFQSEVLFDSGSAEIAQAGQAELRKVAEALLSVAARIPTELKWILRVDGHTDTVPIYNENFRSNWELSTARAISVVQFLIEQGVPENRLAATGFGEFQPLDARDDEIARRRNRRIELKLTER